MALLPALLLGGCSTNAPTARDTPVAPLPTTISPTATPTLTPTPSPSRTPKPTQTPTSDQVGNGDSTSRTAPATAGGGICAKLSAADVGGVLGAKVTGSAMSGTTGCTFAQTDRKAPAVAITDAPFTSMAAAKNDATSAVEGNPEDVPGIGQGAFVVTGTMFGGSDIQAAGAVRLGRRLIGVTVTQQQGLSAAKVRDLVIHTLELAVRA